MRQLILHNNFKRNWGVPKNWDITREDYANMDKMQEDMKNGKTLVVYFSKAGENYAVGNIKKGNTGIIAEMIAEETDGVLFQVEPIKDYPNDYTECTEVAQQELNSKARPAIKDDTDVESFDVVYIGYPIWWDDMPMPIYTFIEKHNWQGKTVVPFCTHEGSGLGCTAGKLEKACGGSTVLKGLAVRGTTAQNSQEQARKTVRRWLANHAE